MPAAGACSGPSDGSVGSPDEGLGTPDVTPELKKTIAEGVSQMAGGHSVEQLAQEENKLLVDLIKLCAQQAKVLAAEAHA